MRKNVSLLSFCRKDLFQVAFKCFCSFKAEKQLIPQISELEDCATFEKKCFIAIILQKRPLPSSFQMLLFLQSRKTIYSTNKRIRTLRNFWEKIFHAIILQKKLLLSPFQMLLFLDSKKKQFIPQISSQNLYMFWVCVLRKKCKPRFTQKVNSNLFIFWGKTNTIISLNKKNLKAR